MSQVAQKHDNTGVTATQTGESGAQQSVLRPAGDIFEHEHGITLLLDMPGVSKDRLDINSDRNTLTVEGEVEISMPEDTEPLHADVRSTHYRRTFSVSGEQLDTEAIEASLRHGVLRIDIPKRAEMRPRRIEVKTA
jgi:HSP20 family molecular chaperone IbpA